MALADDTVNYISKGLDDTRPIPRLPQMHLIFTDYGPPLNDTVRDGITKNLRGEGWVGVNVKESELPNDGYWTRQEWFGYENW